VLLGARSVYGAGHAEGYEDTILIHRDKNPNTKGVAELAPGVKPIQALLDEVAAGRITHVLALGAAATLDVEPLRAAKVVTIAAHDGPLTAVASVLLPATAWAEQTGTYVNSRGMRQISEQALQPQGSARPAWRQVADIATVLGFEASWKKVKQIRAQLLGGATAETPPPPSVAAPAE
jgi:NADH-quinone oxidoreductase subunit G